MPAPAQHERPSSPLAALLRRPATLAVLTGLLAALALIPGHAAHGLWSSGEIPVLQRAQAVLGASLSGLERAPVLPDLLRTQALALSGDPAAIRLPGAIATSGLVALAALLTRVLGFPARVALLAGGFALAFPLSLSQGRLALGNPVGELLAALTALLFAAALTAPRRARALAFALAGLLALALSLGASGLWLGVVLPLVAAALCGPVLPAMSPQTCPHVPRDLSPAPREAPAGPTAAAPDPSPAQGSPASPRPSPAQDPAPLVRRPLRLLLVLGALTAAGVAGWLAYHQGDGYIPVLGAAKDLTLRERPHVRGFVASLEDCGYQLFPWLPLILLGLLQPGRARWPALWFAAGLALTTAWSLVYGAGAVPLSVPAAVLAAAAFARLTSPRTPLVARRIALVLALAGCWVFAKDARRTPSRIGAPLVPPRGEHVYPAAELGAPDLLAGLAQGAGLALLLATLLVQAGPSGHAPSRLSRALGRARAGLPAWLPAALMLAALARQTWAYSRDLLPRTSEQHSLLRPLARFAAWHASGELPGPLGIHRLTDPGVDLYGPPPDQRAPLTTREALTTLLRGAAPAAAMIRASELPPLHQAARAARFPLHVLDASNRDLLLVANVLPAGADDKNPILRVLFDAPPALAHDTLLRFDDYVEIIAWEWDEPLVRGREVELRVVLRPLKPLPSGSKITVRLQQGRLSRINPLAHDLVENIYPPQHWRAGDYLLHRFRVQVPTLEVLPGPHEVVVGMRRTERANYKITLPAELDSPGVHIFGEAREFARIGEVQVW